MPFPPNFDHAWDITQPPDTQAANQLGLDIRNLKDDIMQRMSLLSGTLANRPTPETVNATWGGTGFGLLYFSTDNGKIYEWNGAAWVDVTSSFIGSPGIPITQVDLTTQGANLGPTTILTPGANGFFRASGYTVLTRAATTSSSLPQLTIGWTDADAGTPGGASLQSGATNNVVGTIGQIVAGTSPVYGFYAKSGSPIQYQTIGYASSGGTSMQYSVHLRLEGPF